MKYFIRIIVIIGIVGILIVCFLISCDSKPHYNKKAIFYNDTAIGLFMAYRKGNLKNEGKLTPQQFEDSIYREVIHWYNLAIKTDSTYYLAYANKSQLFDEEMNLPDSALETMKTYFATNKDTTIPGHILTLAFYYDKAGDSIRALEYYKKVPTKFLINKDTISFLFSQLFIIHKDSVLKQFNALYKHDLDTNLLDKNHNTGDPVIKRKMDIFMLYGMIRYFDKKKFFNHQISWQ